jgi:hypothetical protein
LATQTAFGVASSRTGAVPTAVGLPTVLRVLGSSSQSWPGRLAVWSFRLVGAADPSRDFAHEWWSLTREQLGKL